MKKTIAIVALCALVVGLSLTAACTLNTEAEFYPMLINDDVKASAKAVSDEIDAIGEVTWDSTDAIALAREHYDALSEAEKKLVRNAGVLQKAEHDFGMLAITAEVLTDKIAEFKEATKENEAAIEATFIEYWSLDEGERAKVVGYERLCELREDVAALYADARRAGDKMSRAKIQIGTYCFRGSTEEDVQELAECGIDFVAADAPSDEMLAWYEEYNIGAFVSAWHLGLPTFYGGYRKDTDAQPSPSFVDEAFKTALEAIIEKIDACPAIWAIDLVDEPNAGDFQYDNNYAQIIYEVAPGIECYINLFPNYASYEQLGVKSYSIHIAEYVKNVDTDYICYDHYFYGDGVDKNFNKSSFYRAIENYEIVAKNCKESGRDFWVVIQANSCPDGDNNNYCEPLSETELKIQAFVSLAYGAKVINWAGWQDGICWWNYNILDSNGNKSEQYDKVKNVNVLIDAISPIYMKYDWVETSLNEVPENCEQDTVKSISVKQESIIKDFSSNVAVGFFNKKDDGSGRAMLLTNATDLVDGTADGMSTATVRFTLNTPKDMVVAYYNGVPQKLFPNDSGEYSVNIKNGDCVFVTID